MRRPPAYQEYPSDLLANEHYKLMDLDERGLFHTLRHYCWVNESIPANESSLAELLNLTESYLDKTFSHRVRSFFCKHDTDPTRLISPELVDYKRGLIEKSLRRAESGKLGGLRSAETRVKDQAILQSAAQAKVEESTAELHRKKASRG
jgi:hypothetical protein